MFSENEVRQIQRRLNELGATLSVDGDLGPKTIAALFSHLGIVREEPSTLVGKILSSNPAINPKALTRALEWKDHPAIRNKDLMLLVDFSLNDSKARMHVIDMKTGESVSYKVAHGKNSDANKDGTPDHFSNTSGSYMSSLGPVAVGSTFTNPKWKFVRLLEGLEKGRNDRIRAREILLHSSLYVNDTPGKAIGDTLGCFGVSEATAAKLFPKVGGCLLYAWDDSLKSLT